MEDMYATRCTLLDRARNQSDSQAWEELLDVYKRYIYVIIRSMNISSSDTDELLQLVSIQLWKGLPEFKYQQGKSLFRNWVSRVTRNTVLNFLRSQRANARRLDEAKKESQLSYLDSITVPDVEEIEQREWARFITNTAMDNIRKHFTDQALESFSRYAKGESVAAISEAVGASDQSVYKYIHRIRKRLADEIAILKKGLDL